MAQTKFVLTKALKAKLRPVVVINKMDRKGAIRVDEVEGEVHISLPFPNRLRSSIFFPLWTLQRNR